MKKIINTILLLAIALMPLLPMNNARAVSTPQRYYQTYRSQLHSFLINYRGRTADKQGCDRTDPTSDCLSDLCINTVMAQLDQDGYFSIRAPLDRRNYLLNTNKAYPSVMRKAVMWFEQVLNHDTVVYGASQPKSVVQANADAVLGAWGLIAKYVFGGTSRGDNTLLTFAIDRTLVSSSPVTGDIYSYWIKSKSQIWQNDLDKIYATARMSPYAGMNSPAHPDWTTNELQALQPVVDIGNQVVNYAYTHNITPVGAKIHMQAMAVAMGSVGASGRVGGTAVMKKAAGFSSTATVRVGTQEVPLTNSLVGKIFRFSKAKTVSDYVTKVVQVFSDEYTAVANAHRRWMSDIDAVLADVLQNRSRLVPSTRFFSGAYHPIFKRIYISDNLSIIKAPNFNRYTGQALTDGTLGHEAGHYVRALAARRNGFASIEMYENITIRNFMEMMNDGLNLESLNRGMGMRWHSSGYFYDDIFDLTVGVYMRKFNWSKAQALDRLYYINHYHPWNQIGIDLGKPTLVNDVNTMLKNIDKNRKVIGRARTPGDRATAFEADQNYGGQILEYFDSL